MSIRRLAAEPEGTSETLRLRERSRDREREDRGATKRDTEKHSWKELRNRATDIENSLDIWIFLEEYFKAILLLCHRVLLFI